MRGEFGPEGIESGEGERNLISPADTNLLVLQISESPVSCEGEKKNRGKNGSVCLFHPQFRVVRPITIGEVLEGERSWGQFIKDVHKFSKCCSSPPHYPLSLSLSRNL